MRHLLLATTLAVSGTAWMQPPQSATFDPVGRWTYSTRDDAGAAISGTMEIAGKSGAYTGTLNSGPERTLQISEVLTSPNGMIILANLPDGGVAVVKVWRTADGKFEAGWGPIRNVIPATVERGK